MLRLGAQTLTSWVSVYAAGMACREDSGGGGGYYDPTPGG